LLAEAKGKVKGYLHELKEEALEYKLGEKTLSVIDEGIKLALEIDKGRIIEYDYAVLKSSWLYGSWVYINSAQMKN
jgi:hypothetical protein